MQDSFYELDYVKSLIQAESISELNIFSFFDERNLVILPEGVKVQGVSARTGSNMIWTTDRVLAFHTHATYNANIMHELFVSKLYESGKIDDSIKSKFIEDIYDTERPITRHTLLKVID